MKRFVIRLVQSLLGLRSYLYVFARWKVMRFEHDERENNLRFFIRTILPQASASGVFVDVGSNIGVTAAAVLRHTPLNLVCVEPVPINADTIRRIMQHFGFSSRVELVQSAVGEESGEISMTMPNHGGARQSGLSHVLKSGEQASAEDEVICVPLRTLDDILRGKKVVAMKIDVENFEYPVLCGARTILREQHPPLIIELWDNHVRSQCISLLQELGYNASILKNGSLRPASEATSHDLDFIFLPPQSAS